MKSVARAQSWMNLAAAAGDLLLSSASAFVSVAKRSIVTGNCAALFAVPCAYGRQAKRPSFELKIPRPNRSSPVRPLRYEKRRRREEEEEEVQCNHHVSLLSSTDPNYVTIKLSTRGEERIFRERCDKRGKIFF